MDKNHLMLQAAAKSIRNYAERLLTGIDQKIFARKPRLGGKLIEINHAAFCYGHLALYPAIVAELLQIDPQPFKVPGQYADLFKNGAQCHDDEQGGIYPPMHEIVSAYFTGYDRLIELLPQIPPGALEIPLTGERATRFPVAGAFLTHILSGHVGTHLGQVSAWRRCMGLKAA